MNFWPEQKLGCVFGKHPVIFPGKPKELVHRYEEHDHDQRESSQACGRLLLGLLHGGFQYGAGRAGVQRCGVQRCGGSKCCDRQERRWGEEEALVVRSLVFSGQAGGTAAGRVNFGGEKTDGRSEETG